MDLLCVGGLSINHLKSEASSSVCSLPPINSGSSNIISKTKQIQRHRNVAVKNNRLQIQYQQQLNPEEQQVNVHNNAVTLSDSENFTVVSSANDSTRYSIVEPDVSTSATPSTSSTPTSTPMNVATKTTSRVPNKMARAKQWTIEVENLFRFQSAGYRDEVEYMEMHAMPIYWDDDDADSEHYVKSLQNKYGNYLYFRRSRECDDKYLNKIKLYTYE